MQITVDWEEKDHTIVVVEIIVYYASGCITMESIGCFVCYECVWGAFIKLEGGHCVVVVYI